MTATIITSQSRSKYNTIRTEHARPSFGWQANWRSRDPLPQHSSPLYPSCRCLATQLSLFISVVGRVSFGHPCCNSSKYTVLRKPCNSKEFMCLTLTRWASEARKHYNLPRQMSNPCKRRGSGEGTIAEVRSLSTKVKYLGRRAGRTDARTDGRTH